MKIKKSIRNIALFTPISLMALAFTSSTFAVEPTTFPTNSTNKPSKTNPKGMEHGSDDEKNPAKKPGR